MWYHKGSSHKYRRWRRWNDSVANHCHSSQYSLYCFRRYSIDDYDWRIDTKEITDKVMVSSIGKRHLMISSIDTSLLFNWLRWYRNDFVVHPSNNSIRTSSNVAWYNWWWYRFDDSLSPPAVMHALSIISMSALWNAIQIRNITGSVMHGINILNYLIALGGSDLFWYRYDIATFIYRR